MGSSDPTSPRRKASLFNLPGPRARHFSFVLEAAGRKLERALDQLLRSQARLQHIEIVLDLLPGQAIELALLRCRLAGPAEIGAREIRAIAVRPDQIGIEAHQLARSDDAVAG